ncbi:hypothetical protein QUF70_18135 [Desulfobacterales bacterium HSG17]|nr:hypothetical protein [Desulfobacterales bacterium HSG17]
MTRIQKVLKDIANLQDFYKRTGFLRDRIKNKEMERSQVKQSDKADSNNSGKEMKN